MEVKRHLLAGLLCPLLTLQMAWATGDSISTADDKTVIKNYPFVAASQEDLKYDVPQELTVDGKIYKLKDVRYEITGHEDPVTVTKAVQVFDKADYDREITETVDGTALRLVATTPVWHETPAATITKEYDRQGAVASELERDGSYTRTAIYTGTRETPVWTATYQSAPEYTAEITYTDSQYPDGVYEMEAVATYTYHSTLETILKVGAGVLVVALATACVVWFLRKKNQKNKDKESEE